MIIIIGSKIGKQDIKESLGKPEYSYYFLLKEFLPALEAIGTVIVAKDIQEIDQHYTTHHAEGKQVIFLSFAPPHQTPLNLQCPTIPVFAWEFDNTPDEAWNNDPRNDWSYVFARVPAAITLCEEAALAIRKIAPPDFPILVIPAPVWDRFASNHLPGGQPPQRETQQFNFTGELLDSDTLGLSADGLVTPSLPPRIDPKQLAKSKAKERQRVVQALREGWKREISAAIFPKRQSVTPPASTSDTPPEISQKSDKSQTHVLILEGIVYATVLNPGDHRKNLIDLISAFCWAFKNEKQATLIVKMTHHDMDTYRAHILTLLSRLAPFQCRVLVVHGFLEDAQYHRLIQLSSFYVNASVCEGLCLPLMEFLSSGKPALAPMHTAMTDYLRNDFAFLLDSSPQPASWPHDPTGKLKARLHRLNWESLMNAYKQSFFTACNDPAKYKTMSQAAFDQMKEYCALQRVNNLLEPFIEAQVQSSVAKEGAQQ